MDSRFTWLAAPGRFESVGKALKSLRIVGGEGDSTTAVGARQARSLQDWEAQYGMTAQEWLERYGGPTGGRDERRALPRGGGSDGGQRRRSVSRGERPAAAPPQGAPPQPGRAAPPASFRQQPVTRGRQPSPRSASRDADGNNWAPSDRRPAFGDVLQRDGRALEYDALQGPLPTKRRGDAVRGEDAF